MVPTEITYEDPEVRYKRNQKQAVNVLDSLDTYRRTHIPKNSSYDLITFKKNLKIGVKLIDMESFDDPMIIRDLDKLIKQDLVLLKNGQSWFLAGLTRFLAGGWTKGSVHYISKNATKNFHKVI